MILGLGEPLICTRRSRLGNKIQWCTDLVVENFDLLTVKFSKFAVTNFWFLNSAKAQFSEILQ